MKEYSSIIIVIVCVFGFIIGYFIIDRFFKVLFIKKRSNSERKSSNKKTESEEFGPKNNDKFSTRQWYEVLGVSPNSSVDQIQKAYKILIQQYHPDRVANLGPELRSLAEKKAKEINIAYQEGLKSTKRNKGGFGTNY